ncbi:MAG: protein phosphatase 2C domain-containing protein [Desulforegulaceae bacterium]|nr:protein phosphatase 2C domain-containing protein [Desulforegulaceae bacterium]
MEKISHILEKGTGKLNEDAVSINGSVFGVFDGATSLDKKIFENGLTGGFIASNTAKNIFLNKKGSLKDLANKANKSIYNKMTENYVDTSDKSNLWSTSAAVVKIDKNTLNWIQIGDSLILIIYKDGSYKIPVTDFDHDLETLTMWKNISHKTDKSIMEELETQIIKVRKRMNIDYGVLNGEKEFSSFLKSGTEDLQSIDSILLFTDGLFIPSENPGENNFDKMIELFNKGGLENIRDYIRNKEKKDPYCKKYPRFKTHDDIGAVCLNC